MFAQAGCKLAEHLQSSPNLAQSIHKHKELTDLIGLPSDTDKHPNLLVQATADHLNPGAFIDGLRVSTQNAMFVDDNVLANIQEELTPVIATSAESLFILIGEENSVLRKSPLLMEKCYDSVCSYLLTQLGILIKTRSLTIRIPEDKRENLIKIIINTWQKARKSFTLREISSLLVLVAHLVMATQWAKRAYIALQHAVFLAIKFNSNTLFSSGKFRKLTDLLTSKDISIKNFYLAKPHKTVWNSREKFFITQKIELN